MITYCLLLFIYQILGICAQSNSRIVGGIPAHNGEFPFAVAVQRTTPIGTFFCGGAIINNNWIVTTGTCVDGASSFEILMGSTTLSDPNMKRVLAHSYVLHPGYNYATLENDIGLIRTNLPIQFNEYINSIYLLANDVSDYSLVTAIGWGQISEDITGLSSVLNQVEVSTLSLNDCNDFYGGIIKATMLCVAGNMNEAACKGDIGSPLVYYVNGRHPTLAGISSFVNRNGCEQGPSGYTRAFPYNDWILNETRVN